MNEKPEALADRLAAGRLAMVEQLTDEVDTLRRENERLNAVALQAQNAAIDLTKENERLREEVRVLRLYGNKDCTAMADEAMKEAALRREEA